MPTAEGRGYTVYMAGASFISPIAQNVTRVQAIHKYRELVTVLENNHDDTDPVTVEIVREYQSGGTTQAETVARWVSSEH